MIFPCSLVTRQQHILTRATQRHIPEDSIHDSHHGENLKSYNIYLVFSASAFRPTPLLASFKELCCKILLTGNATHQLWSETWW
jgi:hypothetical protein